MDRIAPRRIIAALEAEGKQEVLAEFAQAAAAELGLSAGTVFDALAGRERLGSTGIGHGVALPHARIAGLSEIAVFFGRSPQGIPFDAVDNRPVHLFFVLLAPEEPGPAYLDALSSLAGLLRQQELRAALLQAGTADALSRLLRAAWPAGGAAAGCRPSS